MTTTPNAELITAGNGLAVAVSRRCVAAGACPAMGRCDCDALLDLADRIGVAIDATPPGSDWTPSQIARKIRATDADRASLHVVLDWMEASQHVASNGRGGCWRRYGRRF